MNHLQRRPARGFTLVEIMVTVAIVGLLSSVAIPQYMRMQFRSRASERLAIMDAVGRAVRDTVANLQALPDPASPDSWAGASNPPGAPTAHKRPFVPALGGWRWLPMIVQGDCYYSYSFVAGRPSASGANATLTVIALGDLDGDGVPSAKQINYQSAGWVFYKVQGAGGEVPPAGYEDTTTF